jgi:two-component system, LytTR family, response regulator
MKNSTRFRVVVVDDEATARAGVADLVTTDPDFEVVAMCANGLDAVEAILELTPDLVLLDVQMPRMDGFEVVRRVGPQRMPLVVFVTAYDQFALKAFEVFALDYVLKPFEDDRFHAALARAKSVLRNAEAGRFGQRLLDLINQTAPVIPRKSEADSVPPTGSATPPLTRLVVKNDGRVTLLRVDDVDWIEAADYCVRVHTGGKTHTIRDSMSSLETRLDASKFFRTHRSAIVNLDRIHEIQPSFRGEHVVILNDRTKLPLSRARRRQLETLLQHRL